MSNVFERLAAMTPEERMYYLGERRHILEEPQHRPRGTWQMTEQMYGDLVDRFGSFERQLWKLDETLKILLAHQAKNDSMLDDVVKVKHWWRHSPPQPPPAPQPLDFEKLLDLLRKARKEGLL